jgi:phage/plasmid-like protein (TIGR03299 family)
MSHELTQRTNGMTEFAYLKSDGLPWHNLGQAMEDNASFDDWRVKAGMDWRIKRAKVRYPTSVDGVNDATTYVEVPDKHVLFRSDTRHPLGIVSDKYKVVQPGEVLDFFRDIAHVGGLELSAAGTIYDGKRFWATAKIGEACPASLKDKVGGYLLLSTSADGSLATEVRRTTIRVVCRNTLAMAQGEGASSVKISHRSVFKPEEVKSFMEINHAAFDGFMHTLTTLANKDIKVEEAEMLAVKIIGGEEAKVRTTAGFAKVMDLFSNSGLGAKEDGVYGTAYGLLQGFTEYADHWARARSDENRFAASQWGAGAQLKQRALDVLVGV